MGTDKSLTDEHGSLSGALVAYLAAHGPGCEFAVPGLADREPLDEKCWRNCAKPSLPSGSHRYSKARVGAGTQTCKVVSPHHRSSSDSRPTEKEVPNSRSTFTGEVNNQQLVNKRFRFKSYIHPEGLPYFHQDKFVTTDNQDDPKIKSHTLAAFIIVCFMMKHSKDTQANFRFHEDVEIYIELESLKSRPEFMYYIVDHRKRSIFWGDNREPECIRQVQGMNRETMLREEYWKHVEYYPCHRPVDPQDFEELKELLAAHATDAATSEGSTSPMSASDIRTHLAVLEAFRTYPSERQTWVTARLFGLFIRAQLLNQYGTQEARLDRFESLEDYPPSFQDCYLMINFYLTFRLGDKHLRLCSRTWADRLAYTHAWREYKVFYLREWNEIRNLAGVMLIVSSYFNRIHSPIGLILQRATAIASLLSMGISYHLSNELQNTGDHASDAASYFQTYEEYKYGIQRLALLNCAPQALLCWAGCFFLTALVIEAP